MDPHCQIFQKDVGSEPYLTKFMEINCSVFVVKKLWLAFIFGQKLDLQFTFTFSSLLMDLVQFNVHVWS